MTPSEQNIQIIRNQDLILRFRMSPPRDITGWTIAFTVRNQLGGTGVLSKTTSAGITLMTPATGILQVSLAASDTSSLSPSSALGSGQGYVWDLVRTDSGSRVILARGELILEQEVT